MPDLSSYTAERSGVDFKSSERAEAEDTTSDQLHIYALGYEELTGQRADVLAVLNLNEAQSKSERVDDGVLNGIRSKITVATRRLLPPDQAAQRALARNPEFRLWCR